MAKVVIIIEDIVDEEGLAAVSTKFTSDTPLPEAYEDYTQAQVLAGQLHQGVVVMHDALGQEQEQIEVVKPPKLIV